MKLVMVTACNECPLGIIVAETDGAGCRHPDNPNDEAAIFEDNNPTALPDYVPDVCKLTSHGEVLIRAYRSKILSRIASERLAEIDDYEVAHPEGCSCDEISTCDFCADYPESF